MTEDQAERLIAAMTRLADAAEKIAEGIDKPSAGWRRMLDEFKGAVSRMPSTIRARF